MRDEEQAAEDGGIDKILASALFWSQAITCAVRHPEASVDAYLAG
jgi:hypothetical protein